MLGNFLAPAFTVVSILLALEGLYYLHATLVALRARAPATPPPPARLPHVTVQIPVKDEGEVLRRALDAVAAFDWPRELLDVQVIDDSRPEGRAAAERLAAAARTAGLRVEHFAGRPAEAKAGALQAGLERAEGELVAVFDADFAPPADWLRRTVAHLAADEGVVCVQTRWTSANEDATWMTGAVALALDAHFAVEQRARAELDALLSFSGTAALWRRDVVERLGGWRGRTLAEDVDLSTLALLDGRRFVMLDEPAAPQLVPETVHAFRVQQARWARGSIQCARLHAGAVARASTLPAGVRVETLFHLTHYAVHPLLFALFLLQLARPWTAPLPMPLFVGSFALALAGPLALFGLTAARHGGARRLRHLPVLTLLGLGLSLSNTIAFAQGLAGPRGEFVRTPKTRHAAGRPRAPELLAGVVGAAGAAGLAVGGFWWPAAGAATFAAGFLTVALAK